MSHLDRFEHICIDPVLGVLDTARGAALKVFGRASKSFLRHRALRAVSLATFACGFALVGAASATGYWLLLGPLLFGVPHLVAEARYLFFQRHRASVGLLAVLALQAALAFAGAGVYSLGLCSAMAILIVRAREPKGESISSADTRDGVLLGLAIAVQIAASVAPTSSRFLLLHAHNLIPIALWFSWRARPKAISFTVLVMLCLAAIAILGGAFDALPLRTPLRDDVFSLTKITDAVAGGFHGPSRKRWLMLFAFTQSVHYAFWLRMIPEEARERETPRTWAASWRAFKADSGANVARLAWVLVLAVPLFAFALGAVRARSFYVRLSEFHATVEMVLVFLRFRVAREGRLEDTLPPKRLAFKTLRRQGARSRQGMGCARSRISSKGGSG